MYSEWNVRKSEGGSDLHIKILDISFIVNINGFLLSKGEIKGEKLTLSRFCYLYQIYFVNIVKNIRFFT